MQIPAIVDEIIHKLQTHSYEAFAVGGCIRDVLLGIEPKDWDITTSALPQQVKKLFPRTVDTGIEHGTVTVMYGKEGYEVTTYRIDGEYEDGRHPKEISFTSVLLEDLKRRDFTINAMAYSHQTGIIDAFGGREDLEHGVIRCVGDPEERFFEDALRILRAIRISAELGFTIEPLTWAAVKTVAPNIEKVSKERIQMELSRILLSDRPEAIQKVNEAGIGPFISPAFARLPWDRIRIGGELPLSKALRWAAFLQVVPAAEAVQILRDLKLDHETIKTVWTLLSFCGTDIEPAGFDVRLAMSQMEPGVWDALLDLKGFLTTPEKIEPIRQLATKIRMDGDCLSLSELAVKGQDLLDAGMCPGIRIGEILRQLLHHVLRYPGDNQKELLLKIAGNLPR